jgi:hypothetical protein
MNDDTSNSPDPEPAGPTNRSEARPQYRALLALIAVRYKNPQQMLLEKTLSLFKQKVLDEPDEVIAVPLTELSNWAVEIVGSRAPTPNAMGRFLTSLGWVGINRFVKGTTRDTERMRVLEGATAKQARQERGIKDPVVTKVLRWGGVRYGLPYFYLCEADKYDDRNKTPSDDGIGNAF